MNDTLKTLVAAQAIVAVIMIAVVAFTFHQISLALQPKPAAGYVTTLSGNLGQLDIDTTSYNPQKTSFDGNQLQGTSSHHISEDIQIKGE